MRLTCQGHIGIMVGYIVPGRVDKIGMWLKSNIEESNMEDKMAIFIPDSGLADVN